MTLVTCVTQLPLETTAALAGFAEHLAKQGDEQCAAAANKVYGLYAKIRTLQAQVEESQKMLAKAQADCEQAELALAQTALDKFNVVEVESK